MGIVVDTCIWVDVERGRLSPADVQAKTGKEPVFISPVTIAELTYGVEMASGEDLRQQRIAALERLKKKPLLLIDDETGVIMGRLLAALRMQKRDAAFRIQDLWIASLALQHDFILLTNNLKDFEDIPGLSLVSMCP